MEPQKKKYESLLREEGQQGGKESTYVKFKTLSPLFLVEDPFTSSSKGTFSPFSYMGVYFFY